jgi:transaldolase
MKFFIDTADVSEIREAVNLGILDGVTTNPTLISKTGRGFEETIQEICSIVNGPVNAEVISLESADMIDEAKKLSKIDKKIVVKIPMTTEGMKAVKTLSAEGIKTNVTLVFSPTQALMAAKAGADYVSPFIGRLDDASHVGMGLISDIKTIFDNYAIKTEIIVASIRNPLHVVDAAILGADIATIPFAVIKRLTQHPLTDVGIERFVKDWEKVPKK